ncbi:KTSC domain-containing protein [Modestobacter roseus]|uniref:KTSC domain-containing protein n=1 Tax=Modestobacter roseus TaxID=1181884 RepID=A0A562IS06_9ACTN|nr:KTSC domain-containing protein [Modestobacter roseus]MQA32568.1 KTSC domain-containing protein [Modestobacter roseus]TWH73791.1 KTSC domain-containing protein [Modestobacter roseus]
MRRAHVQSSSVRSVGYDLDHRVLEIEYVGGGVYDYLDVPPEEALALLESDSIGRYLNGVVKPHHRCRVVHRVA